MIATVYVSYASELHNEQKFSRKSLEFNNGVERKKKCFRLKQQRKKKIQREREKKEERTHFTVE